MTTKTKILYRTIPPTRAYRLLRRVASRSHPSLYWLSLANSYDVWEVVGTYVARHLAGKPRLKHRGIVAGRRGEWYRLDSGRKSGPFRTRGEAALARAPRGRSSKPARKYYGVRRGYGDDLYSWAVYDKRTGRTVVDGESRQQAGYIADKLEREARETQPPPCSCRPPGSHQDCAYCGVGGPGTHVCGVCREAGIDGPVIRGTERRTCRRHATPNQEVA